MLSVLLAPRVFQTMGVLRDRFSTKLRSRRGAKSVQDESITETISTPLGSPSDNTSASSRPPQPSPNANSSATSPLWPSLPTLPRFSTSASSTTSRSTIQDTSTKLRRLLRTQRPTSRASTASTHLEDDVPEPEPRLLPSSPATTQISDYPPDTRLTDGYVSLIVPQAWRAVRADDAIYLLSGQGVGFVKSVRAVDACEVLLQVSRLSVMSQVLVRSSPVWKGCEATVEYYLEGGFGVGIARFQHGFDAGAVVFAVCAPNDRRQLVTDAVESIRRTAKVIKVPENDRHDNAPASNHAPNVGNQTDNGRYELCHDHAKANCVLQ